MGPGKGSLRGGGGRSADCFLSFATGCLLPLPCAYPCRQAALSARLRAYVAAETEDAEAEALRIESVQQMRELLRLVKAMLR